jgi:hypothetical protein
LFVARPPPRLGSTRAAASRLLRVPFTTEATAGTATLSVVSAAAIVAIPAW